MPRPARPRPAAPRSPPPKPCWNGPGRATPTPVGSASTPTTGSPPTPPSATATCASRARCSASPSRRWPAPPRSSSARTGCAWWSPRWPSSNRAIWTRAVRPASRRSRSPTASRRPAPPSTSAICCTAWSRTTTSRASLSCAKGPARCWRLRHDGAMTSPSTTRPPTDFTVIGAGIVGLATAYALTQAAPGASLTVLEKEDAPARHQTGRNSGVIHSGIYYRPGSLKARYALAGSAETPEFAAKHGVPYEITGKLIVATEPAELPRLAALFQRGREHGLSVTELGPDQITSYEPQAAGLAALHVASTGICDFAALTTVLARLVTEAGGTIVYGQRVTGIERVADGEVVIRTAGTAGSGAGVAAGTGVAAGAGATAGTSTGSRAYGGGSAEPAGAA